MLTTIAIGAGILVAALLGFAATKPGTFRVQRTKSIQAPPEKVFALINDFRRWGSWSPYEKLDPTMKRTYSGAANGKGAVYAWWAMHGPQPYFAKVMAVFFGGFFNMDRLIGKEFEAGLANLRSIAENQAGLWEPGSQIVSNQRSALCN